MFTMTLANGTKLENLELNGNNYIAPDVVEDSVFEGNMDTVIISDGTTEETYSDMRLMSNIVRNGQSWIVIGERSKASADVERLQNQVNELTAALNTLLGNQ